MPRELEFDGENHDDVLRHVSPHALRGGVHLGDPGDEPVIHLEVVGEVVLEIHKGDLVVVDDEAKTIQIKESK